MFEAFKTSLKEQYLARMEEMAGMSGRECMGIIKNIIAANDIVIGVWPDSAEPSGIGFHCIKGVNSLREIVASDKAETLALAVVPCIELEQAIAAQQVFGDRTH